MYDQEKQEFFSSREVLFDERADVSNKHDHKSLDSILEHSEKKSDSELLHVEVDDEPRSYDGAVECRESECWIRAMHDEYESLISNQTWKVEPLPAGKRPISS